MAETILLLIPYIYFLLQWNFTEFLSDKMFSTPDAQQYKAYGEYLTGSGGYASDTRPYLYPLLTQFCYVAGGSFGLWFMQALLHIFGGLLLFSVVRQTSKSFLGWLLVVVIYGMHPSLAVHTLYGLTETVSVFLMAMFVYFISRPAHQESLRRVKAVGVLAVAVVVKPVFLYVFLFALVWLIWRERSFLWRNTKAVAILCFSLAVFFTQPVLMKIQQGDFFVSRIGEITLRDYYFRLLYARTAGINFPLSQGPTDEDIVLLNSITKNYKASDILKYAIANPLTAVKTGAELVYSNIDTGSLLVGNMSGGKEIKFWGHIIRKFTLASFILALLCFLLLVIRRKLLPFPPGFSATMFLLGYILLVSGISFWQGDRLVIFALPLWLVVFPPLYIAVWRSFRSQKTAI